MFQKHTKWHIQFLDLKIFHSYLLILLRLKQGVEEGGAYLSAGKGSNFRDLIFAHPTYCLEEERVEG